MKLVHPVCCGIDVHKATVVCCLRRALDDGKVDKKVQIFGTTTPQLVLLLRWLVEMSCPIVAMESTGVYWKPVFNILHDSIEVIVGNARQMKQQKGHKTDKKDASWISDLLAHGLIQPNFVPPPHIRGLRDLTRMRENLINTRTQAKNRVLKTLEEANIKLSNVASQVFGKSGRAMLTALVEGERNPQVLAQLAQGVLRKKIPQLIEALEGRFTEHHAMLVRFCLEQIALLDRQIEELDQKLSESFEPIQDEQERLGTTPGIDEKTSRVILSEIGTDMSRFGSEGRLASWASMCPGNNESAGKRKSGKTRKGNKHLRRTLVQCAWAASKTDSFLGRTFWRLAARIGKKKAAVAIAHKILIIVYHLLDKGTSYEEERYDDLELKRERKDILRAQKLLQKHGYDVQLKQDEQKAA